MVPLNGFGMTTLLSSFVVAPAQFAPAPRSVEASGDDAERGDALGRLVASRILDRHAHPVAARGEGLAAQPAGEGERALAGVALGRQRADRLEAEHAPDLHAALERHAHGALLRELEADRRAA